MRTVPLTLACLTSGLIGCSESPVTPTALDLNATDIADVAQFIVGGLASIPSGAPNFVAAQVVGARANVTVAINNTLQCPAGGTSTASGSLERTPNQATQRTTVVWTTTVTHQNCAFSTPQKSWTFQSGTITVNGDALFAFPASPGAQPAMLAATLTRNGSIVVAVGDQSRSCAVENLVSVYNASNDSFTTTGKFCGQDVTSNARPRGGLGSGGGGGG